MDGRMKGVGELLVGERVKGSSFGGGFAILLVCVKRDVVVVPSFTSVEVSESMF
jgi:hypothetical protein